MKDEWMDKPLFEMRKSERLLHLGLQDLAKQRGIEFLAGPQGRVLHVIDEKENCTIKDIEKKLEISKSVASNLVKRMEKNGFVTVEVSSEDKRSKFVRLTDISREKMAVTLAFFEEVDSRLMADISEEDFRSFLRVLEAFRQTIERMKEEKND